MIWCPVFVPQGVNSIHSRPADHSVTDSGLHLQPESPALTQHLLSVAQIVLSLLTLFHILPRLPDHCVPFTKLFHLTKLLYISHMFLLYKQS